MSTAEISIAKRNSETGPCGPGGGGRGVTTMAPSTLPRRAHAPAPRRRARPFLLSLAPDDADELQRRLRVRACGVGQVVLRQGAVGDHVVLLLEGKVKLTARAADGRETLLAILGPGELLGELTAIDGEPRTANVIALTAGRIGLLSTAELEQFMLERPGAARALLRTLAQRIREADRDRLVEGSHDVLGRLAVRLLHLAELHGDRLDDGVQIELDMTQEELASWTGASRETVARSLGHMRRLGWVSTHRRGITVLDLEALRAKATSP